MKMNKRGQGISLHTIVIAAIALIVLIILVFIFTGRINIFGEGLEDCASKAGGVRKCAEDCSETYGKGYVPIPGTDCDPEMCCVKIFKD